MRTSRFVALAGAAGLAAGVVTVALQLRAGQLPNAAFFALVVTVPILLGLRIGARLPGHGIALRLVLLGLAVAVMGIGNAGAALAATRADLLDRWAVLLDDVAFLPVLLALGGIVAAFPSGTLAPRWRRGERAVLALCALLLVAWGLTATELEVGGAPAASPLPVVDALAPFGFLAPFAMLGWLVAVAVGLVRRYRTSTGIERLQLSWLAYSGVSVPLLLTICFVEAALTGSEGTATTLAFTLPLVALPTAVGIAVLRHRLYDIDRLVNRTLVYLALSAALAATYAAVAVLIGVGLGGGTGWTTAAATLAVVTAFGPLRARAQSAVDRRFARRRYDGLRLVEAFLEEVRAGRDEPERIGPVLRQALGDRGLEVAFRLPESGGWADAAGRRTALPDDDPRARTPVRRGDLELGVVLHDPALAERPDTLDSILRATGLAMEIARLRVELRVQLAAVEDSRSRLAVAAEAERRKLERDLHDGAQQRLVALGLALRHAQHLLGHDADGARATLDGSVAEVATAVAELRALARGLRPALLDDGLAPVLSEIAARSPVPVVLEVAPGVLPDDVERTAYFVACEAITNAVKHAEATRIRVRVAQDPGGLTLEVADDGRGGATGIVGGGLTGVAERVALRGGTVDLVSPRDGGTRLHVHLPVGA